MINKFLYIMLICTWKVGSITINIIISLHETLTYAPNILSKWINKSRCQRHKKQHKISHDGGNFSQNLRASKHSSYNERNCKSGRLYQQDAFMHCKLQSKGTSIDNSNLGLEIKGRNKGETKSPPPHRRD